MIHTLVKCFLTAASALLLGAGVAFALTEQDLVLSRAFDQSVRSILERHFSPEQFQVVVRAEALPKPAEKSLPYVPFSDGSNHPAEAGSESHKAKKVEIEVLLGIPFAAKDKTKLAELLLKKLALDPGRGDSVRFSDLGFAVPAKHSDLEDKLARTEADDRELRNKVEALARDREDAKRELLLAKIQLAQKTTALEAKDVKKEPPPPPAPSAQPKTEVVQAAKPNTVYDHLPTLLIALALFAGAVLGALAFGSGTRSLSRAVETAGKNLPLIGQSLSDVMREAPAGREASVTKTATHIAEIERAGLPALPNEALHDRAAELAKDLMRRLTEPGMLATGIRALASWVEMGGGIERAAACLEFLDQDIAMQLFKGLAPDCQQAVQAFLAEGRYSRPKLEVKVAAAEELITRLVERHVAKQTDGDEALRMKIIRLSRDDLASLLGNIDTKILPRLLYYIEPSRLAKALHQLMLHADVKAESVIDQIVLKDSLGQDSQFDKPLHAAVDIVLARGSKAGASQLSYVKTLVEKLEPVSAELVASRLLKTRSAFAKQLEDHLIVFETFFRLAKPFQTDILAALSNHDIAALLALETDGRLQDIVKALVTPIRGELIAHERGVFDVMPKQKARTQHFAARNLVARKINEIKGAGPLQDLLATEEAVTALKGAA